MAVKEVIDWFDGGNVEMGTDFFNVINILIEYVLLTDRVKSFREIVNGS